MMPTIARRCLSAVAAIGAATAVTFAAGGAAHASTGGYVALGDSYSSGVGAGDYTSSSGSCDQSTNAYGQLWANANSPSSFSFEACSGATTSDVLSSQLGPLNSGTSLVSITQMKPIYASFTLPATNLDAIRQNEATHKLEVDAIGADGGTVLGKGTLSFIDNHIDTSTGTIALKGTFENAAERLWPGEFINARLILSVRHNAVTVPEQTVMAGPAGSYVYVIRSDDTVQRRDVQLASRQDGMAVIAKGLAAGEKVVVEGQYRLANDVKVRIETTGAPAATSQQAG